MFKEIFQAFSRRDVVKELTAQIGQMLEISHWMFDRAQAVLAGEIGSDEIADELYAKDQEINRIEQGIREKIMTHLSVGNDPDLGPCLALMSIVKDAERVGDYCKNIFEVGKFRKGPTRHREFAEPLAEIGQSISEMFPPVQEAFLHADKPGGKQLSDRAHDLSERCDMILRQLLSVDEDFAASEAVAYALLARYYKRIEAHLSNVVTGVTSPLPMLDFRKPKK